MSCWILIVHNLWFISRCSEANVWNNLSLTPHTAQTYREKVKVSNPERITATSFMQITTREGVPAPPSAPSHLHTTPPLPFRGGRYVHFPWEFGLVSPMLYSRGHFSHFYWGGGKEFLILLVCWKTAFPQLVMSFGACFQETVGSAPSGHLWALPFLCSLAC